MALLTPNGRRDLTATVWPFSISAAQLMPSSVSPWLPT